jgi:hypothetical protein
MVMGFLGAERPVYTRPPAMQTQTAWQAVLYIRGCAWQAKIPSTFREGLIGFFGGFGVSWFVIY